MQSIEEIHQTLEELKKERRELNKMLKDELSQVERYVELVEEMKAMREEKKRIENEIKMNALSDKDRLDEIKSEVQAYTELMSDVALNKYMNNETIEIVDAYDNKYVPVFIVKFKKDS